MAFSVRVQRPKVLRTPQNLLGGHDLGCTVLDYERSGFRVSLCYPITTDLRMPSSKLDDCAECIF